MKRKKIDSKPQGGKPISITIADPEYLNAKRKILFTKPADKAIGIELRNRIAAACLRAVPIGLQFPNAFVFIIHPYEEHKAVGFLLDVKLEMRLHGQVDEEPMSRETHGLQPDDNFGRAMAEMVITLYRSANVPRRVVVR